jgi:spore germination protein YaaH
VPRPARLAAVACLAAGVAALGAVPAPAAPLRAAPRVHVFYYPMPGALERLRAVAGRISAIAPEWWTWRASARRLVRETTAEEAEVRAIAEAHGIALWPAVNLGLGRRPFFAEPGRAESLTRRIAAIARTGGYDGVTLDLEGVAVGERSDFVAFTERLAEALHDDGRSLAVYLPRPEELPGGSSMRTPFDYARLAQAADLLLVSAYSESWLAPGPITTSSGLERVLAHLRDLRLPRERVAVTLGAFGYLWRLRQEEPERVMWTRDAARACAAHGPVVDAGGAGRCETPQGTVWFETDAGLGARVAQASASGVAGWISLFLLGAEDRSFWTARPLAAGAPSP